MKGLVEAVANVVLFILTPAVVVWVQSTLAMAIETLGKSPMEKNEARAFYPWVRNLERTVLDMSRPCLAQTAVERK